MSRKIICRDCGHYFALSANEIRRYRAKNYHIPTRCPACRNEKWRAARQTEHRIDKYERNYYHE